MYYIIIFNFVSFILSNAYWIRQIVSGYEKFARPALHIHLFSTDF
jgi:hypothetical protein